MKQLSILVVDDEETIRNLVEILLVNRGHKASTAADGKSALRKLSEQHFDLVITDIIMPDMDGIEIISSVKKMRPEVRILAISGGGGHLPSRDCLRIAKLIGAHVTLAKPFKESQLLESIGQACSPEESVAS